MRLATHFIVSLLLAVVLYPFVGYISILIIMGGFLIDVDHYLYYMIKHKSFSIKKAHHFFNKKKIGYHEVLCIFHTFESMIIIFLLGFFSIYLKMIAIGYLVHFTMDMYYAHQNRDLRKELPYLSLIVRFVKRIR